MFLYFAYNNYSKQVITYDNIYIRNIHIQNDFIKIGLNNSERISSIQTYDINNEDNLTDWDIEKGNPEEYENMSLISELNQMPIQNQTHTIKPMQSLSLLVPVNYDMYEKLCEADKNKHAEIIETDFNDDSELPQNTTKQ